MLPSRGQPRLHCYVDETGQDTLGELFVVSVVVSGSNRDSLALLLERIEHTSGKGRVKWKSARHAARIAYMQAVLSVPALKDALYFSSYKGSKAYMALTVLSTAKAILSVSPAARATVYVDGLPKSRLRWFGKELRRLSVRTEKVSGVRREESDALIRLADACCGFVRLALAGNPSVFELFERAKREGYLREV